MHTCQFENGVISNLPVWEILSLNDSLLPVHLNLFIYLFILTSEINPSTVYIAFVQTGGQILNPLEIVPFI